MYGALVEFAGLTCPLTDLEKYLRHRAGEAGYRGGFIAHYLVAVIYPPGLTRGMQVVLGVLVLVIAAAGYWLHWHRRAPTRRYARSGVDQCGRLGSARLGDLYGAFTALVWRMVGLGTALTLAGWRSSDPDGTPSAGSGQSRR